MKIIVATVKGDIHDIGKNIVKALLENYGFDIIDLGKDVRPDTVVEKVIEYDVKLVGLSALMTTTVPFMEATIRLIHEKSPDTKIMVGGAVLTKEYADETEADRYCKDAMASVKRADIRSFLFEKFFRRLANGRLFHFHHAILDDVGKG